MWVWYALGSAFFAGITAILAKCGLNDINTNLATAIRTIVILLFSWALAFLNKSVYTLAGIDRKTLLFLLLSGIATGASWLCYFKALQMGKVYQVTAVDKSSTILTILFAFLLLGEPLTFLKTLGVFVMTAGTYLMIEQKEKRKNTEKGWFLFAALSAVFAALSSILAKIGIENVNSVLGTAVRTVVVLIMAWSIVFINRKDQDIRKIGAKNWIFLTASGFATGASWLCYFRALQIGQASIVVPVDKLSVLITMLFSCLVLKETFSLKIWIGLFLLTGGTLLLFL